MGSTIDIDAFLRDGYAVVPELFSPAEAEEMRQATIEEVGWELFRLMLDVASGRTRTWAERHRLHNALVLFNPAPVT